MLESHFEFWPERLPRSLSLPQTSIFHNLEVSARRYPEKPVIVYYSTEITYRRLLDESEKVAGYLEHELGITKGDRVLLYLQNSPQFVVAFYAILRLGAVVVPVNPMLVTGELSHYVEDSGRRRQWWPGALRSYLPSNRRGQPAACSSRYLLGLPGGADGPRRPGGSRGPARRHRGRGRRPMAGGSRKRARSG